MNKKGFTLVELMAVIIVLSLLMAIAIPSSIAINSRIKEQLLEDKIVLLEKAAILWGQDNKSCFTINNCEHIIREGFTCQDETLQKTCTINPKYLVNEKYFDEDEPGKIENPADKNKCLNNYNIEVKYIKKSKTFRASIDRENQNETCSIES